MLENIRTNGKMGLEKTIFKRILFSIYRKDDLNGLSFPSLVGDFTIGRHGVNLESSLRNLYCGKDIYGKHEEYLEQFLQEEIDSVIEDDDFNLIDFVSFSGNFDNTAGYKHAYGFENLSVSIISSIVFKNRKPSLHIIDYQHLLAYYQYYFNGNFYAFNDKEGPRGKLTSWYILNLVLYRMGFSELNK